MSAIRLRTGSRTRPLTEGELQRAAAWLAHHADNWMECKQLESGGATIGEADGSETGSWETMLAEFLARSDWERGYWLAVARGMFIHICQFLGDKCHSIREQEDRH